jgi:hypothetical protein
MSLEIYKLVGLVDGRVCALYHWLSMHEWLGDELAP